MPKYSTLEKMQMGLFQKLASLNQAMPFTRSTYDQWTMQVTAVANVAPYVKRITCQAKPLRAFQPVAADEYFGLLMPKAGQDLVMPGEDRINIRASIQQMPEDQRPDLRWYTVRAHRPIPGEIDIDIVTHGDAGPGSAWALRVAPGDQVGMRCGSGSYLPPTGDGHHLIVADETALPAVAAIADSVRGNQAACDQIMAFVELPDDDHATPIDPPFELHRHYRGAQKPGSILVPHMVSEVTLPELSYAWVCGEQALATGVRRHLVKTLGMDRKTVMFSGYWKLGAARG